MKDYSKMTSDDFDRILMNILDETKGGHLISIAGVYEAVSEHFNNDVLDKWREEQEAINPQS